MSLTRRCQAAFDSQIRDRGRIYANTGRVDLQMAERDSAWAVVRGSGRHTHYDVDIEWQTASDGYLEAWCTCPFVADRDEPCKHIWGTLLELDHLDPRVDVPGSGPLDIVTTERVSPSDEDDLDDDQSAAYEAVDLELDSAPDPDAEWRPQLDLIRQQMPPEMPLPTVRRAAWFILERPLTTAQDAAVRIAFYRRDSLQNGDFGKLKPSPIDASEIPLFETADQHLLKLLYALGSQDWEGLAPGGSPSSARRRSVPVAASLFPAILPMLCATGRFGWLVETDGRRQCSALVYDADPTWRLTLRGEHRDGQVQLLGTFERLTLAGATEQADLDTPWLVDSDGWMFFSDRVGRLANPEQHLPWVAVLQAERPMQIPDSELDQALAEMAEIPGLPTVRLPDDLAWPEERLEPTPCVAFRLDDSHVVGTISFQYGPEYRAEPDDPRSGWTDRHERRIIRRDLDAEAELLNALPALVAESSVTTLLVLPADAFVEAATSLRDAGWHIEAEGRPVRPAGQFTAQVASGVDWFELSGSLDFGDQVATWPALLTAVQKNRDFVVLGDGSVGLLPEEWLRRFTPLAQLGDPGEAGLRFGRHQALVLDALLASESEARVDTEFDSLRDHFRAADDLLPDPGPPSFEGTLRPYQQHGLAWMHWLAEVGFGGCLADDMGLGKTIQVLAYLEHQRDHDDRPSLLVVPRSLLYNWQHEARRFTPALHLHLHHGADRHQTWPDWQAEDAPAVLLTTYGTLLRDIVDLQALDFDVAVLDEAQAIKNSTSQTAKACRLIQASHRLALTGTPIENHIGELWSLFTFLNPGMLDSLPGLRTVASGDASNEAALSLVARAIRPLVLRRTKQEVLPELPAKTEQTLICELSPQERDDYDQLRRHYHSQLSQKMATVGLGRSKVQVLEALLRLRQAACHPGLMDPDRRGDSSAKLDTLMSRLREVVGEGDKALVFSQFTRFLGIVRERLDQEDMVYEYLDGRTHHRQPKVDRFQNDPDCSIFLISLKAGGVGLNLTAASYVFILDPWWNPAVEAQAIDRAHRIGQDKPVFAYRLIAKDSVEEKIVQLQDSKRSLAEAIIARDSRVMAQLTAEDLALLLGGAETNDDGLSG